MPFIERDLANAIRFLSIDAVEKAKSGHPGMPLGMADIASVLWRYYLKHNPKNSKWVNRDRFVLSNGHGSMLLYSLLHLTGYKVTIDDLKNFRKLNSATPGHPEYGCTDGVETTTGPLGQGFANAVGMAIAEKVLANYFNRENYKIVDHYTYCFVGDGCLMEGISHEVGSFAGTLGLEKLIVFWDDNKISIDGNVENWFSENTAERFSAYNWQVIADVDGHSIDAIKKAIDSARNEKSKPTIICLKTQIGYGSPNLAGSEKCHGSPLGNEEVSETRKALNWDYEPFFISDEIYKLWDAREQGEKLEATWNILFEGYQKEYPKLAKEFIRRIEGRLPDNFDDILKGGIEKINNDTKNVDVATRKGSKIILDFLSEYLPELIGGSSDLTDSNLTFHKNSKPISKNDFNGNYIHYGVREFAMAAIMNGISLHGGFVPYGGTFLVFADYAKSAIRMSALINKKIIYVLTHDSIGLGEDGPTHQPVEQLSMLRSIPNMTVWRPADIVETFFAWCDAVKRNTPCCIALTRQKVTTIEKSDIEISNIKKGAYIIFSTPKHDLKLDLNIIATGSEVNLAINVAKALQKINIFAQVVSMPSCNVFDEQDVEYKNKILPKKIKTVAIEAASSFCWYKYVGGDGLVVGLDSFGKSAPYQDLFANFGFTVEDIVHKIKKYYFS